MHIEKLPSGSYRITQTENGVRYRITLDHKPSNAEAVTLLAKEIRTPKSHNDMTFKDAAETYIASKENILSPVTVKGYYTILQNLPKTLCEARIASITSLMVQTTINDLAALKSAKTVKNYSSFIMTVLKAMDIEVKQPRLPQKEKKSPYIPTEEDIKALFTVAKGTKYEIPLALAAMGLRRSEIAALTIDDLDGNILHINKAMIPNKDGEYIVRHQTKTSESTRDVVIPDSLADLIREKGIICDGTPDSISHCVPRLCRKAGIPEFSIHKMRHFFASYMLHKGYNSKQIQEMGGWATDNILKTVYQHAMEMDKAKKEMADSIGSLF